MEKRGLGLTVTIVLLVVAFVFGLVSSGFFGFGGGISLGPPVETLPNPDWPDNYQPGFDGIVSCGSYGFQLARGMGWASGPAHVCDGNHEECQADCASDLVLLGRQLKADAEADALAKCEENFDIFFSGGGSGETIPFEEWQCENDCQGHSETSECKIIDEYYTGCSIVGGIVEGTNIFQCVATCRATAEGWMKLTCSQKEGDGGEPPFTK